MEEQRSWTSDEAMGNLERLTGLDWNRELPEGVAELLQTYETAIPQLTAEIRHLRRELHKRQREGLADEPSESEGSKSTTAHEDLDDLARRLGLDQR